MTLNNDNITNNDKPLDHYDRDEEFIKTEELHVGHIVKGRVEAKFNDFSFVRVDKLSCILPHSEISYNPKPKGLKAGTEIEAVVIRISEDKQVMLSIKRLKKDPWVDIDDYYRIGQRVHARITSIAPFGVFVEFDDHIPGLIHKRALSDNGREKPSNVVTVGQIVEAEIIEIDKEFRKIQLSLKKRVVDHWEKIAEKYEVGQRIHRKVVKINQGFGVFVELEPGFKALLHISEMGLTKKHVLKNFISEGDYIDVEIKSIETEKKRIALTCNKNSFIAQSESIETNE